jgi:hypothetical protein
MNNQVMLEALEAQLSVKQNEADKYHEEVYTPQLQDLKNRAIEMLNSTLCPDLNLIKRVEIQSESMNICISEKNTFGNSINFSTRGWNDDNRQYEFSWYSGDASTNMNDNDRDYGILIGRISEKFDSALELVRDVILPEYREINSALETINISARDLGITIRQLKDTIDKDNKSYYYKPGFHLKLKEYKTLDWVDIADGSDERMLVSQPGVIKMVVGRSKYDNEWVREFKVIKKKGYKYELEVVTNYTDGKTKIVEVTEMRMEEFVNSVYHWETIEADKKTKRAEERFAEIEASKNSTTLPSL